MRTTTVKLFPNFAREIEKINGSKCVALGENVSEVPKEYIDYITHVNTLNGFKDEMANTTLIDDVTDLVHKGETLNVTRNCVTSINKTWNKWVNCCTKLQSSHDKMVYNFGEVDEGMADAKKCLEKLCKDKDDKYAKKDLDAAISHMIEHMGSALDITSMTAEQVSDFYNSYDEQKENFVKIANQLGKEASLQEAERDKITARIKQLRDDISYYNAGIATLAVSMGIGITMVTGSFFISAGVGVIISLFILPAVAVAISSLVKLVLKIKKAQAEIASYGDYKNEYDNVISKLNDLKDVVNETKDKSILIKRELNGVIAPWNALKEDLKGIKAKIETKTFDSYEDMKSAFEEVAVILATLEGYLDYLDIDKKLSKVVSVDVLEADADFLENKANGNGVSLKEFLAA